MNTGLWRVFKVAQAYKKVFSSEEGKIVLEDLMKECLVLQNCYRGNDSDLLFNEGKRNVGLYVLAKSNVDLVKLTKMLETRQSQGDDE